MSYLVLARKSRPQTFAEVVGQEAIVRTLQNALGQNRVPHALIFSGVRGTGKTTLARIMAKALNCEQGPAPEPCNTCQSCLEITAGASIDLHEMDGATNRGIQEIRELKEKIRFMPTSSHFKIIIIDEVHMLTTEAFNALLKTLEEPPAHVYFMFATTELHKVPLTILSRCQRYELKRLGHHELAAHFNRLAAMEGVTMEPKAVEMIVREANGSVRDGLSLLDQIFSYCGTKVQAAEVIKVLGLVSHQLVANLGAALLNGDLASVYTLLDEMYLHGADNKRFSNDLLNWFRALVICKVSQKPGQLLEVSEDELVLLEKTADEHSLETLTALFNLLLDGLEKAAFSQQPRLALEMAFIRAVQLHKVVPVSELIARFDSMLAGTPIDTLPLAPPTKAQSAPPSPSPVASKAARKSASKPTLPVQPVELPKESAEAQHLVANLKPPKPPEPPQAVASPFPPVAPSEQSEAPAPPSHQDATQKHIRQHWDAFLTYVRERQPWVAADLQKARSIERKGDDLIIHFTDSTDCSLLKQRNTVTALSEFVLDFFKENLSIQFAVPEPKTSSLNTENGPSPLQERQTLANDTLVLIALDVFTGQVGEIRTGKRYRTSAPPPLE